MEWCEAVIHTTSDGADAVSELLMRHGAAGTEIIDRADVPDPSKPGVYWELYDQKLLDSMPEDVLVKAWLPLDAHIHDQLSTIRDQLNALQSAGVGLDLGTLALDTQAVADSDWSETWKRFYKPFRLGNRLVVKPSWEEYAPLPEDLVIELDPGMAFGTGTHETTSMCLEMLEKHLCPGMRVMDVGTGSGILAIAAARLGAGETLAIDIDPDAVRVAKENIAHNGVADTVRTVQGDLCKSEAMPCELAVANIVADAICMLAGPLTKHLLPGGLLVCSGIIREREADVLAAARTAGYSVFDRMEKGEWVALALRSEASRA